LFFFWSEKLEQSRTKKDPAGAGPVQGGFFLGLLYCDR
jgi:hypothetical protein